jgi:hypothetical protein
MTDPLPSWNQGAAKSAIVDIRRVTKEGSRIKSARRGASPRSTMMALSGASSPTEEVR